VHITSIFLLSVTGDVITKKVLLSQHPKSKQHYSLLDEHFLTDSDAFFNEFPCRKEKEWIGDRI